MAAKAETTLTLNEQVRRLCENVNSPTARLGKIRSHGWVTEENEDVELLMFLTDLSEEDLQRVLNKESIDLQKRLKPKRGTVATLRSKKVLKGSELPFIGKIRGVSHIRIPGEQGQQNVSVDTLTTNTISIDKDVVIPIGKEFVVLKKEKGLGHQNVPCPCCGEQRDVPIHRWETFPDGEYKIDDNGEKVPVFGVCRACHHQRVRPAQELLKSYILGEIQDGTSYHEIVSKRVVIPIDKADIQVFSHKTGVYRVRHEGNIIPMIEDGNMLREKQYPIIVPASEAKIIDVGQDRLPNKARVTAYTLEVEVDGQVVRKKFLKKMRRWASDAQRVMDSRRHINFNCEPKRFEGRLVDNYETYGDKMSSDLLKLFNRMRASRLAMEAKYFHKKQCEQSLELFAEIAQHKDLCVQAIHSVVREKMKKIAEHINLSEYFTTPQGRKILSVFVGLQRTAVLDTPHK